MSDPHPLVELFLFHVHILFSIAFFFGVFALYRWIVDPRAARAKRAALWSLAVGSVGATLTIPFCLLGRSLPAWG